MKKPTEKCFEKEEYWHKDEQKTLVKIHERYLRGNFLLKLQVIQPFQKLLYKYFYEHLFGKTCYSQFQ